MINSSFKDYYLPKNIFLEIHLKPLSLFFMLTTEGNGQALTQWNLCIAAVKFMYCCNFVSYLLYLKLVLAFIFDTIVLIFCTIRSSHRAARYPPAIHVSKSRGNFSLLIAVCRGHSATGDWNWKCAQCTSKIHLHALKLQKTKLRIFLKFRNVM